MLDTGGIFVNSCDKSIEMPLYGIKQISIGVMCGVRSRNWNEIKGFVIEDFAKGCYRLSVQKKITLSTGETIALSCPAI